MTSRILKATLNIYGELHLDRERAQLLIRWIESQEKYISELNRHVEELVKILKEAKVI